MKISVAGLLLTVAALMLPACASMTLESVSYGWPVESVVTVTRNNMVDEGRYVLVCNVARLAQEEFQDTTALIGVQLRLLRNNDGLYFITGPRFRHVYVFAPGEHQLSLRNAIEVSKTGLVNPALNLRPPHVELIDGDNFKRVLSNDDIVEGKRQ